MVFTIAKGVFGFRTNMASRTVSFFCPNKRRFKRAERFAELNDPGCVHRCQGLMTRVPASSSLRSGQCPPSPAPAQMTMGIQFSVHSRTVAISWSGVVTRWGARRGVLTSSCLCIQPGGWRQVLQKGKSSVLFLLHGVSYARFQAQGKQAKETLVFSLKHSGYIHPIGEKKTGLQSRHCLQE